MVLRLLSLIFVVCTGILAWHSVFALGDRMTSAPVPVILALAGVQDPWRRSLLKRQSGSGSGFVWDSAGHIVTNAHVIHGASSATVTMADERRLPARLVGVA